MGYSKIVALGHHVPEKVITNEYLSTVMDTSNEWIIERTGVQERRWIDPDKDTVANMAAKAAHMALERAKLTAKDIDFIVFATITPDYFFPGSGVLLGRELGLDGIPPLTYAMPAQVSSMRSLSLINSSKQGCIKRSSSLVQRSSQQRWTFPRGAGTRQ
jgi:3-oxoacyl-[acyl-carrier-protein] synthase III